MTTLYLHRRRLKDYNMPRGRSGLYFDADCYCWLVLNEQRMWFTNYAYLEVRLWDRHVGNTWSPRYGSTLWEPWTRKLMDWETTSQWSNDQYRFSRTVKTVGKRLLGADYER